MRSISEKQLTQLSDLKNKMLIGDGKLLMLIDFSSQQVTEKSWFGRSRTYTVLTSVKFIAYHPTDNYWGDVDPDTALTLTPFLNLQKMRNDWLLLRKGLEDFGITLRWAKDGTPAK